MERIQVIVISPPILVSKIVTTMLPLSLFVSHYMQYISLSLSLSLCAVARAIYVTKKLSSVLGLVA